MTVKQVRGGISLDGEKMTVAMLKAVLKDVPDDVEVVVRTDYYYEYATDATYEEKFYEIGQEPISVFLIEG